MKISKNFFILILLIVLMSLPAGAMENNEFNSSIGINSIYSFPLGNYDKDINSGPGFGLESNIMVKDNVSVHLYLNYLGLDGEEIFGGGFDNVYDQRYNVTHKTQYSNFEFLATLQFNHRLSKIFKIFYLNAGTGLLLENYKNVSKVYDNNVFLREFENKYSNLYSLIHIGAGLEQNLTDPIGLTYAFAFDRVYKSNSEFKFKLNVYLGFVYNL